MWAKVLELKTLLTETHQKILKEEDQITHWMEDVELAKQQRDEFIGRGRRSSNNTK